MRNKVCHTIVLLSLLVLMGCGVSKEEISETVKSSMQTTFNTGAQFSSVDLQVQDLVVAKVTKSKYDGVAKVLFDGKVFSVPVDITVDGKTVLWNTASGTFDFITHNM